MCKRSIVIVGGTFDEDGGSRSKIVDLIAEGVYLSDDVELTGFHNGGCYDNLSFLMENTAEKADIVLWFANVPNHLKKVTNIKNLNSKIILVGSKRNTNEEYTFQDLMAKALEKKNNLMVEFRTCLEKRDVVARLLDPLGNQWYPKEGFSYDMVELGKAVAKRTVELTYVTRQSVYNKNSQAISPPDNSETNLFLDIIRESAETFSELIRPSNGVTRYLGNASFRCERGFPSMRADNGIFVSRRNVDKAHIGRDAFVYVERVDCRLWYHGEHKPSVDTPIQSALYALFPWTNYMLHSHVYVEGAPFSSKMIPCGGLEEIAEIISVLGEYKPLDYKSFAINLKGHGSIIFTNQPESIRSYKFYARPRPELMK